MELTKEFFEAEGYTNLRQINGKWYGISRMIYTTGVFCDLNHVGNNGGRICFHTTADAVRFLETWDGETAPTEADGMAADKRKILTDDMLDAVGREAKRVAPVIQQHTIHLIEKAKVQNLDMTVFLICLIQTAIESYIAYAELHGQKPEFIKQRLEIITRVHIENGIKK